tara:strand:+ start:20 stop:649 length:630 start_codon:yes stop_codon:yes gene_type:complete
MKEEQDIKTKEDKNINEAKEDTNKPSIASESSDDIKNDDSEETAENYQETIKNYEEKIENLNEEKLRLLAEMENLRKRAEKEKSEVIKFGNFNLLKDILSPNDNLDRALENIPKTQSTEKPIENLIDGLKMVKKEFITILEKHGVQKIDALNKKFDHNYHQAMLEIESDSDEEGTIIQEIQPGYILNDRLLRPTLAGVAKKTEKKKKNK